MITIVNFHRFDCQNAPEFYACRFVIGREERERASELVAVRLISIGVDFPKLHNVSTQHSCERRENTYISVSIGFNSHVTHQIQCSTYAMCHLKMRK